MRQVGLTVRNVAEYPLEEMQGARRGHARHTGSVDGTKLDLRHIEGEGG